MKRPRMPARVRRAVYERDGYACRHCGWSMQPPPGYAGRTRIGLVVGTEWRRVFYRMSMTGGPDIHRYKEFDIYRYLEVDHVVPLIAGGTFKDMSNLQTLCSLCNNKKGTTV